MPNAHRVETQPVGTRLAADLAGRLVLRGGIVAFAGLALTLDPDVKWGLRNPHLYEAFATGSAATFTWAGGIIPATLVLAGLSVLLRAQKQDQT